MRISIVIPTYNAAKYLTKAIDSILGQPFADKELWVVDGGSKDGTIELLKGYGNAIKWLSEPDKGQCDAIIKGFSRVTGEIFAYLNADDWYEPDIFLQVHDCFSSNRNLSLVYGDCNLIYPTKTHRAVPAQQISVPKLLNFGNLTYQPSTFFLKSALEAEGGVTFYTHMMEYDMNIKALKHGFPYYINKPLANFLIRPDQKSQPSNRKVIMREVVSISNKHGGSNVSPLYIGYLLSGVIPQRYVDFVKDRLLRVLGNHG